ncbi:TonB-dependent receptor plug domain-containing protein [Dyella caseinilytica]|uniref:TonB-dependent receptor n=1 Tax=Dyella caseinilytica TaxID=1849581 RepID=A0ABX7GWJ4_9GAMM|nr:TonB-dependent receptor [Dyella caseinilytica]QRN54865.1 TonB-dependent receptor [Dyella caseinilytica]GFZ97510.1 TonB-dependent receptor [Dyella caseinilytica]
MNTHQKMANAIRMALALGSCVLTTVAVAQAATPGQQSPAATTQTTPPANASSPSGTQSPPAQAQTTTNPSPPQKTVTLQGITVTGSLIRSVDVETAQPVTELSHEALQQQGFISVGQILQNVSSVGSSGTSSQSALGNIVGQYVSLRGLGAPRTLVLVDGQRWTTDIFGETDLSTIPSSIIDHVEILQDGASAIYGSDAIAGVVNIITKKDFDGLQVDTYNSMYSPENDGKTGQFSLTGGKKFSRGSILFNITAQNTDGLTANERDYSKYGFFSLGPNYPQSQQVPSPYGTITGALNPATGLPVSVPQLANGPITVNMGQNGLDIANYHVDTFSSQYPSPYFNNDYQNSSFLETLIPDDRLRSYTLKGDYKLTDHITATFTGTYNTTNSDVSTSGYELSSLTPANGAHLAQALGLPAGTFPAVYFPTLSSQSYYNPLPGNNLEFELPLQYPNRINYNKIKQYGWRAGLEGDFTLGENEFNWDAGYSDFRYDQSTFGPGNLNMVHVAQAVGPSFMGPNGVVECGTPGNVIAGCVPLNPFSGAGGITPAEINYLNIIAGTQSYSEMRTVSANLSGDVFTLPQSMGQGDVTFAVGADHRDISGGATPDEYTQLGLNTNLQQNVGAGSYGLNEAYAEVNLPVLKDMPGAQLLDFDLAHRFSHYTNFGNTNNNQFKVSWQPINDLLVRASYGTGFRAPAIANLYGGTLQSFTTYTDPCDVNFGLTGIPTVKQRCLDGFAGLPAVGPGFTQLNVNAQPISQPNSTSTTPFFTGANPNLKPETSKSYTAGFVYSPHYLTGFNATVDWYRIHIDNVITLPTATSILDNCYELGVAEQCAQFQRSTAGGPFNGQVINMLQALVNQGFVEERGEDLNLTYLFPQTPVGQFKFDSTSTYIDSVREQITPGGPIISNTLGAYDTVLGPLWRFRSTVNLNWSYKQFGATWTIRYYSSLSEPCIAPNPSLSEVFPCNNPDKDLSVSPTGINRQGGLAFNDLQLNWQTPWKGRIAIGATDVFNRKAPLSYTGVYSVAGPLGPTGTDGYSDYPYNPQYDIGRVIYLKYEQKFF